MSKTLIQHNGKLLARLNHSIGTRRPDRPLFPIEVSDYLLQLLGNNADISYDKLGERFNVSGTTIKQLIDMQRGPAKFRDIWGWGTSKDGRIAWSQFREACNFFDKGLITEDEFGILVNGVLNDQIRPDDIREIVRLKKKNPDKPFKDCCREILNTVPQTIRAFVFIADIDPVILKNMREKADAKSITVEDEAQEVLTRYVGSDNVDGVLIKDDKYIKIAFTESGRKNLEDIMLKDKITMKNIINHLFTQASYVVSWNK